MAEKQPLPIAHLFLAGIITAAGAGLFWWIASQFKRKGEIAANHEGDELDEMLLAAQAQSIE